MGKMVDKDELELIKKMVRDGNIESNMLKGEEGKVRMAGVDFPKTGKTGVSSSTTGLMDKAMKAGMDVAENTPPAIPGSNQAKIDALQNMLGKVGKKGIGKAGLKGLAGLASGGLSLGAEAFDAEGIGPRPGSEEYEMETMSPKERDLKRYIEEKRSRDTERIGSQDSMEKVAMDKVARDNKIEEMFDDGKSFEEADAEAAKKQKIRDILSGRKLR
jgi:hypothetical protein